MSPSNLNQLIARVTSDGSFRKALREDPKATLAQQGIEASPELIEAIQSVEADDLTALARDYENLNAHRKAAF